jgi:hypothetical protein
MIGVSAKTWTRNLLNTNLKLHHLSQLPLYHELIKSGTVISTSRDSVVGMAIDYGLDDRLVGVRIPVRSKMFFLHVVHTGSGAHPVSYPMGTGVSFPGGKAAEA